MTKNGKLHSDSDFTDFKTCKLNGVEPYGYFWDILVRLVAGHPVNRIDDLLPWNWVAKTRQQPARGTP